MKSIMRVYKAEGLEELESLLEGKQLQMGKLVGADGIEPPTFCV